MTESSLDLVVVVADADLEQVLRSLLTTRLTSLRLRSLSFEMIKSPQRDAGVLNQCVPLLRGFLGRATHALVLFDHEGCGRESDAPAEIELDLEAELRASGWEDRARVVVISPELDVWVWSDSPHVENALRWRSEWPVREWLTQQGHWAAGAAKPHRPKEALELALRPGQRRRLPALYAELARSVSLDRCTDASFQRLRTTLTGWFGERV